jgi:hypothetical protein
VRQLVQQGGLADARFAGEQHHPAGPGPEGSEAPVESSSFGVPADQPGRLVDLVRAWPGGRRRRSRSRWGCRRVELGVLPEDAFGQVRELRARVQPVLLDEDRAVRRGGGEGVGSATGPVQGEHELAQRPFPARVLADERFELGERLEVLPGREQRVEAVLGGVQAQLVELDDRGAGVGLVGDVRQGVAPPERKRLVEGRQASRRVAGGDEVVAAARERLEPDGIHPLGRHVEDVATRAGVDDRGSAGFLQQPPQVRDVRTQRHQRLGRRVVGPQVLDEPVGGDHTTRVEHEREQQHAELGCAEADRRVPAADLQRSQDGDVHTDVPCGRPRWSARAPRGR